MSFRAVIFDLDGTLLDTLADIGNSANRVLERHGFPTHPLRDYCQLIGEGVVQLITKALPAEHRDAATVQTCLEEYRKEYGQHWNDQTRPYPGIPELLDALTSRGLRLAVLSNKTDEFTQRCVRELLPRWRFEPIIGARATLPRKPDPAGTLEIARNLNIPPAEFLYVGDSGVDMQTAVAAKMFAVGVLWGFRGREELEAHGARILVERPAQILELVQEK